MPEREMSSNILFFLKSETKAASVSVEIKQEARLAERVCAGEQEAFEELYRMFSPMVHGIILARVPRYEVDDLVQEVFLLAYKKLHTLRDRNAVGAWLAMIARNRAAEFYRTAKITEELPETLSHYDSPQTEAREILEAIRSLPETYRETLILRLVEGLTGPEIADQTGITAESVRVNLHRGMKLLRQKLGIKE